MPGSNERRTIAAISSPPGPGERAVIRVSGPRAFEIVRAALAPACADALPAERRVVSAVLDDGRGEQPVLLLCMPGPRSFTREDTIELHVPGAPALAACALERLLELGAATALPGEFTRRAFENGRIDLTRAEGLLELVLADNEAERRAAALLLTGGLADRVGALRALLDDLRALCEASLDFDEAEAGHVAGEELKALCDAARGALAEAFAWEEGRARPSGHLRIALFGAPNAGKSSLFNALAGADALVSDIAGTTRDVLEARLDLGGLAVVLLDAPGLDRATSSRRAAELARREFAAADLVLWVVDASRKEGEAVLDELTELGPAARLLLLWNKLDRTDAEAAPSPALRARAPEWVGVSARDGRGLAELVQRLRGLVGLDPGDAHVEGAASRESSARHRAALASATRELDLACERLAAGEPLDLVAEGLRAATAALDAISGSTTPEAILDRMFARFCVGK